MRAVIFVTPVLQLLVLGYAATTDVTRIPTAVADLDRTAETRHLVQRFEGSGYFRVTHVTDARGLGPLLDRGTVKAALQIDPGFTSDLKRGRPATLQVLVDGTDSNTAGVVVDAKKERIGEKAAVALARGMRKVVVSKGSKVVSFDLETDRPSDADLAAVIMGPTGNLRAPALKAGTTLLVGFNEDAWDRVLSKR